MSTRVRWALTADGFEKLLDVLGQDRQAASREYEELRRWLIGLFTWTGGHDPESLADVTLDRAAKRLAEGERIENLKAWLRVAAKRVLQESNLKEMRERSGAQDALRIARVSPCIESDHHCLQICLNRLPPENARLLQRYYGTEGDRLIPARKQLAGELGISIETLRTRALRLRRSLECCLAQCKSPETKWT